MFLSLLRRADPGLQIRGVSSLRDVLAESVASRAAADQADLLGALLDWFAAVAVASEDEFRASKDPEDEHADEKKPEKTESSSLRERLASCVELCAAHSLSARHFRTSFRILRDASVGVESRRLLLRTLGAAARREGPAAYFDLAGDDGASSSSGAGSLSLRRPPAWPSGRGGYTFAAWMRVEAFPADGARRVALFAMRTASGLGVAAELSPRGVELSTFSPGASGAAKSEAASLDAPLGERRWTFLVVSHTPGRPPLSAASAKLYVDGEAAATRKLRFPRVTEPLTACCVGAFDDFDAAAAAAAAAASGGWSTGISGAAAAPFRGQLGAVRFFDDALGANAVAAMYALGPDYLGAFSPAETAAGVALAGVGMSPSEAREARESLAPRLQLSLNAAAAAGRSCYSTVGDAGGGLLAFLGTVKDAIQGKIQDGIAGGIAGGVPGAIAGVISGGVGPEDRSDPSRAVAAELVGAARVCATHSAKDIVHCLGGVHVLLPLVAPPSTESPDSAADAAIAADAVDLLAALLEGSRLNQEALHATGGFALLAHLLRRDGGRRLSPATLPAAERLVRAAGRFAWAGPGGDQGRAAVRLLLDLRLWGAPAVPAETLAAHATFLRKLARRDPAALRSLLPPPTLVDAAAEAPPAERDPIVARRRRRALLSVAATLLPGAVPAAYAELAAAAVCAVEEAGEMPDAVGGAVATDVLEATVEMLQPGQPTRAPLARAFAAECGGPAAVLAPLARPHAETRALAIRLLAALLPRSRNDGGGPGSGTGAHASAAVGFEKFAAAPGAFVHSISSTFAGGSSGGAGAGGSGTGTASGSSRSLQAPPGLFAAVAESLLMYPLTPDIRAALFELVLGGQPVPAPRAPADRDSREGKTLKSRAEAGYRAASKVASAAASKAARFMGGGGAAAATTTGSEFGGALLRPDADASSRGVPGIVHAAAAGLLLRLLEKCPDAQMREGVLELLLRLVEGAPANAQALLEQAGWQEWLVPGARGRSRERESGEDERRDSDANPTERELTFRMFRALHAHAVLRTHGGASAVETSIAVIAAAADRGGFDGAAASRRVFADAFDALLEPGDLADGDGTPEGGDGAWTVLERPALSASPCGENLWALVPLVDAVAAEAAKEAERAANDPAGDDSAGDSGGERLPGGPGGGSARAAASGGVDSPLDAHAWRMFDATWRIMEALANPSGSGGGVGLNRTASGSDRAPGSVPPEDDPGGTEDFEFEFGGGGSRRRAAAQRAALQRVAFRLVLVYVHHAPMASATAAAEALESLLPALLARDAGASRADVAAADGSGGRQPGGEKASASARLHLFLTSLVRAESAFANVDPGRARLAERLVAAAAGAGKDLLGGSALAGGVVGVAGGGEAGGGTPMDGARAGAIAAAVVSSSAGVGGGGLRGLISDQKAAAGAAEEAREGRRVSDALRDAAVGAGDAAAVAYAHQRNAERALRERHRVALAALCDRERQRRALARAAHEEEAQTLDRRWRDLYRELTGESGAWAAAADPDPDAPPPYRWKLDKVEDSSQRRLRLKRDYQYVQYRDERGRDAGAEDEFDGGDSDAGAARIAEALGAIKLSGGDVADDDDEAASRAEAESEAAQAAQAAQAEADREAVELSREDRGKVLLSVPATLVNAKRTVGGRVDVSRAWVHFVADKDDEHASGGGTSVDTNAGELPRSKKRFWRWSTTRVDEVHHARYRLQHVAVEIFLSDRTSAFLAFADRKTARDAAARIAACKPGITLMDRRRKLEAAARAQERWRRRELSTFDYVMALNTLAGRTRNDLTQYPVFPWVLSDYESDTIDLNNPRVFRDLSKPVGALDPKRLEQFEERYTLLAEDPDALAPPFHYGSHYSSAGIVLFYLLRLEPFTALGRQLQGGLFDHADRLFSSVAETWRACLTSTADVKELIPEFYSLPEFLENANAFHLGTRQDGVAVGDVELPPWAKGSTHEFVRVMREALESETVSARIHEWIDLVFGAAQHGPEAVRRKNVFHHLTYEGSVNLGAVADPAQRAAAEAQIINFGQTPAQLFKKAHPRRAPPLAPLPPLRHAPHAVALASVSGAASPSPVAFLSVAEEGVGGSAAAAGGAASRVIVMTADRHVWVHRFARRSSSANGSLGAVEGGTRRAIECEVNPPARVVSPFAADAISGPQCFATLANDRVLLSCGHWDHGLRAVATEDGRELQIATGHRDLVTCLAVASPGGAAGGRAWAPASGNKPSFAGFDLGDQGWSEHGGGATAVVVSGSRDTTIAVWDVSPPPGGWGGPNAKVSFAKGGGLGQQPKRTLFGHNDAVTCVAASAELDLVASGGADGAVLLHALRSGRYLRATRRGRSSRASTGATDRGHERGTPTWICLVEARISTARVLVYCADRLSLAAHGVNDGWDASPLATAAVAERLHALALTPDERYLVTGGEKGAVVVRGAHDLAPWARYDGPGPAITAMHVTADDCVVGGLADGRIAVWASTTA